MSFRSKLEQCGLVGVGDVASVVGAGVGVDWVEAVAVAVGVAVVVVVVVVAAVVLVVAVENELMFFLDELGDTVEHHTGAHDD